MMVSSVTETCNEPDSGTKFLDGTSSSFGCLDMLTTHRLSDSRWSLKHRQGRSSKNAALLPIYEYVKGADTSLVFHIFLLASQRREFFLARLKKFFYLVCEAIGTAATPGLLCQRRVIVKMIVEKQMKCRLAGETEVLGENLPQRHICPSQNPT
jgi:hypothetical protein